MNSRCILVKQDGLAPSPLMGEGEDEGEKA
jgi:hypothetical protein